ncbi:MAG: non-ribosomal peptide synthetase, partial [bacterium]|nr:non-ribosomal peptide synthetase [bacterium]
LSIDDNFFEIGGHSLKATLMVSKIHKEFSIKLPLAEIFKNSSVRTLAKTITEYKEEKYSNLEPVEKKEYYPLSSAQKRMYFLQQMDLNSTAYNMPLVLPVTPDTPGNRSPITGNQSLRERLQDVFDKLILRHESLRTSFKQTGEAPVQRIHDRVEFRIVNSDISGQSGTGSQLETGTGEGIDSDDNVDTVDTADTLKRVVEDFVKPFDLALPPLLRAELLQQAGGEMILLVDMHHIISDGTSHMNLAGDFFSLYSGKELKPLRLQYKDFSTWQNHLMETGKIKEQEEYWLELYRGEIPRINLYTDKKRPEVFSFAGDNYRYRLGPEETAEFKALAADCGGTLYMNLLAALNTLFYKYTGHTGGDTGHTGGETGQNDIIIGSGIAGRPHADLQKIVGMFVNTLAMRNNPHGDQSYRTFFGGVIERSVQAFQNQDVQLEELV